MKKRFEDIRKVKRHYERHGMTDSRFFNIWYNLRRRCLGKTASDKRNYTSRGIKNTWKSFTDFMGDMYPSYVEHVKKFGEKQTTIDRIDNDGNYSKENCRWATYSEQNRNVRRNVVLEYKGRSMLLVDWAKELGFKPESIIWRIKKYGLEQTLSGNMERYPREGAPWISKRAGKHLEMFFHDSVGLSDDNEKRLSSLTFGMVVEKIRSMTKE